MDQPLSPLRPKGPKSELWLPLNDDDNELNDAKRGSREKSLLKASRAGVRRSATQCCLDPSLMVNVVRSRSKDSTLACRHHNIIYP